VSCRVVSCSWFPTLYLALVLLEISAHSGLNEIYAIFSHYYLNTAMWRHRLSVLRKPVYYTLIQVLHSLTQKANTCVYANPVYIN